MAEKEIVIVGSGLSALMLAKMIRTYKSKSVPITIIEKESKIGGQFGSFEYGEEGFFDQGMHIYYESCISEIDDLFTSILPVEKWNILEGNYKDAAGLFYNGKLQIDTPYVDLREVEKEKWKTYAAEIFEVIKLEIGEDRAEIYDTASGFFESKFGKSIAEEVFDPIFNKLYGKKISELSGFAVDLTTVNRIALFNSEIMDDLMRSNAIRSRICYPDQYTLPIYRNNTQRGFYPKKFGMYTVIEELKDALEKENVNILTSCQVTEFQFNDKSIDRVSLSNGNNETKIIEVDQIFWTAGLPSLANVLKINYKDLDFDKQINQSYYVNMRFDKNPNMDKLYYFYCFDEGYRSFRVTNYGNYCPNAINEMGYAVCVELWMHDGDDKKESAVLKRAEFELMSMGVINDTYKMNFGKVERANGGGFPLPTVTNIKSIGEIRNRISERGLTNLTPIGVLVEEDVFFIKDVLQDAYNKVTNVLRYEN